MLTLQISYITKDESNRTDSWNQTLHEHSTHRENFLMDVRLKGVSSVFVITAIKKKLTSAK